MRPTTRVVFGEWPPNGESIARTFRRLPRGVVFAHGNTIYVPGIEEGTLPDHLIVHEETHFAQQVEAGGPDAWWERYLADAEFRLAQELEAYRAQLASIPNRPERRLVLREIVKDLGGPMYGGLVTKEQARALLSTRTVELRV